MHESKGFPQAGKGMPPVAALYGVVERYTSILRLHV